MSDAFTANELKIKVTFTEEVLGTASANKEVHAEYIASKGPDAASLEEEIEAIGEENAFEKAMTVFLRDKKGNPAFWNYQWKGYLKESCAALQRGEGFLSSKGAEGSIMKAYRKIIDKDIFVSPRMIPIILPEGEEMDICQRPLRGQTPQGERIALASSQTVPAGSTCEFKITYLNSKFKPYILEWLKYGEFGGTGQWRNSGKGTFTFEIIK